ncbi:MAG: hypothetical protein JWM77_507, partial [Rhodospirillales bacterium]|nr:hypothetical protein [Rhodospirillales bacterium]
MRTMMTAGLLALLALPVSATAHDDATIDPNAPPLEQRSYIRNMQVLARHFPGEVRNWKMQMMTVGERRFLAQSRDVLTAKGWETIGQLLDVTDPLKPRVVSDNVWSGEMQVQLAYNKAARKWLLISSHGTRTLAEPGLRGIRITDVTDPASPRLLSEFSVDGGDPRREVQTGKGPHRNWYDGGRYAYLSASPNNDYFVPSKNEYANYRSGLEIVDLADPAKPKLAGFWHVPGQRIDEREAQKATPAFADPEAYLSLHGGYTVPKRVEQGGRYGFGPWSSLGMVIHDISDVRNPQVVSTWRAEPYVPGPSLAVHTVDVSRLDRKFVILSPEAATLQCAGTTLQHESYILDVSDIRHPKQLSKLPMPTPPPEAPYDSFCKRFGRFGVHNAPHLKAPGKVAADFTCYTYFAGGLQCYDIADPKRPSIVAYFIPTQGGAIPPQTAGDATPAAANEAAVKARTKYVSTRNVDSIFIEW